MQSDLIVERLPSPEIPSFEVTVKVTQCENRFEIVAKPGAVVDYSKLKALLTNWVVARIDAQKARGHNPRNSERG
jgi:hypothetical protein